MTTSDAAQDSGVIANQEEISRTEETFQKARSIVKRLKAELKQAKKEAKRVRKKLRKLRASFAENAISMTPADGALYTRVQPEPRRKLKSKSPRSKYPDRAHESPPPREVVESSR